MKIFPMNEFISTEKSPFKKYIFQPNFGSFSSRKGCVHACHFISFWIDGCDLNEFHNQNGHSNTMRNAFSFPLCGTKKWDKGETFFPSILQSILFLIKWVSEWMNPSSSHHNCDIFRFKQCRMYHVIKAIMFVYFIFVCVCIGIILGSLGFGKTFSDFGQSFHHGGSSIDGQWFNRFTNHSWRTDNSSSRRWKT